MIKIIKKVKNKIYREKVNFELKNGKQIFTINTKYGFKVILDVSKDVDKRFLLRLFEVDTIELIQKLNLLNMTVIDVGANIGLYSLLFSNKIGLNGKVYSFEPSSEAYYRLLQNIKYNKFTNVKPYQCLISDKKGDLEFNITDDDAYNSIGSKPMKEIVEKKILSAISIDEFTIENNINNVDIIKTDTEGADYSVLKGAEKVLEKYSPIIFCEYNRLTKDGYSFRLDSLIYFILSKGYNIFELEREKLKNFDISTSIASEIICIKNKHKTLFKGFFRA